MTDNRPAYTVFCECAGSYKFNVRQMDKSPKLSRAISEIFAEQHKGIPWPWPPADKPAHD